MFKGSFTALITPFQDGNIDEAAFQRFINWQIEEGVNGLVPCGTTGESATMTPDEQLRVIELCLKATAKRVPVIAGTGANDTKKTIQMSQEVEKLGVDALLVVTPYYNKPTPEGMFQHYKAVHDATNIPIILYNVPGRTSVNLDVDTIARLSELPRIAGIKDATPDMMRPLKIRQSVKKDFSILSGEDASVVAFLAHGGDGCISVTSNIAPKLCARLHKAWTKKEWGDIELLRDLLLPLHEAMFIETSPGPVKFAASLLGYGDGSVRLPLWEISGTSKEAVYSAMQLTGVIKE